MALGNLFKILHSKSSQVQEFITEHKQYIFNAHTTWAVANIQYTFYNIYIVRLERNIRKHSVHSQENNITFFEQLNIYCKIYIFT